jgi:hypothetical protein
MECFENVYALAKIGGKANGNGQIHFEQELNAIAIFDWRIISRE